MTTISDRKLIKIVLIHLQILCLTKMLRIDMICLNTEMNKQFKVKEEGMEVKEVIVVVELAVEEEAVNETLITKKMQLPRNKGFDSSPCFLRANVSYYVLNIQIYKIKRILIYIYTYKISTLWVLNRPCCTSVEQKNSTLFEKEMSNISVK